MPSSSSSHSYSSPKLGPAAIYSTHSPTGSPRPLFAQQLPGTLSPYRDASARYAHIGSPRISSLSREATAALTGSNYPTSSSRPTSPTPGSPSHSPSSDSGESSGSSSRGSSSRGSRGPAYHDGHDNSQPLLTRSDSFSRIAGPLRHADPDDPDDHGGSTSAGGPSGVKTDCPSGLKRVHLLQPIDTKSEYMPPPSPWCSRRAAMHPCFSPTLSHCNQQAFDHQHRRHSDSAFRDADRPGQRQVRRSPAVRPVCLGCCYEESRLHNI